MNTEYIKDYRNKELKQYVLAYLLITIASVGFFIQTNVTNADLISSLFRMATIDASIGAICALVFVFNELWPDRAKTKLVYNKMPSDTVFSSIASGKIDSAGFDLADAQNMYAHLSKASADKQTAEWNRLLRECRATEQGSVIEAERLQHMTRDICMSTVSLLIMNIIALIVLMIISNSIFNPLKMLGIPLMYLFIMFFVTKVAAVSRANRFVALVVKNAVQCNKVD